MPSNTLSIDEPETTFADESLELDDAVDRDIVQTLRLWNQLRDGRSMPPRAAFRLEDLRFCVGRINLIEIRRDPLDFVYRIRGTSIAQMHREDCTGRSVSSMAPPAYRDMLIRHYAAALDRRAPVLHRIRQFKGTYENQYRRLCLPLAEDGETVDMLLTVSCWDADFARGAPILGFR